MRWLANGLRIAVLAGSIVAALGSAATQPPPPPQAPGAAPQASPCEYACGQVARCNAAPYAACLVECQQSGKEQQPGGPEELAVVAHASCDQIGAAMQGQLPTGDSTPSSVDAALQTP